MQYNGGKKGIAKQLAAIINLAEPKVYWEPFCGMCSVGLLVNAQEKHFSDADEATIAVLKAARDGFEFPTTVTREQYFEYKALPPSNPLHGFAKYGCSFAGKPWGGYAKNARNDNYAFTAQKTIKTIGGGLINAELVNQRYNRLTIAASVIYADPPYAGTTSCGTSEKFDTVKFWDWARDQTVVVFVSEYQAPEDFICVFEKRISGLRTKGVKPQEKLFLHERHTELIAKILSKFPM